MENRLKPKEIKEAKKIILESQNYYCPLCDLDLTEAEDRNIVLDHNHDTGFIRSVLCRHCNHTEGKILHLAGRAKRDKSALEWLENVLNYVKSHNEEPSGVYHPNHKTDEEKREALNKKRQRKRKQIKRAIKCKEKGS